MRKICNADVAKMFILFSLERHMAFSADHLLFEL